MPRIRMIGTWADYEDEEVVDDLVAALHNCSLPWKVKENQSAPIQLRSSMPVEPHHRAILSLLNKITDTKMAELVQRTERALLPRANMESFGTCWQTIRVDFVAMLMEKAQDEAIYIPVYTNFLSGLHAALEARQLIVKEENEENLNPEVTKKLSELTMLRELTTSELSRRFDSLFGTLCDLHSQKKPWDDDEERLIRSRLTTFMNFMVLMHHKGLYPGSELIRVKEKLAVSFIENDDEEERREEMKNRHSRAANQPMQEFMVRFESARDSTSDERSRVPLWADVSCVSAEMLAIFLYHFGYLNLVEQGRVRPRSNELCLLLKSKMARVCNRQKFVIMRTLELQNNRWIEKKKPNRLG